MQSQNQEEKSVYQGWSQDKDFYDVGYGQKMIPKQFS